MRIQAALCPADGNTQNDANHVHSVWHDPRNGFGADLLRAHYRHDHHRHA